MPDTSSPLCGYDFSFPVNFTNISSGIYSAFAINVAFNIFTCPLAILLNIMVMIAVKTNRQLRTKPNISLACLATTDLAVGLFVQPLYIILFISIHMSGSTQNTICAIIDVSNSVSQTCVAASFLHLLLVSGERYLAIQHPFAYENGLVTEVRIIMASSLAWMCALTIYNVNIDIFQKGIKVFLNIAVISTVMYFHVVVYKEVRRSTLQIIANQVSLELKEKLLKNKKAFNTTVVILVTLLLCYIPISVWMIIFISSNGKISSEVGQIVFCLVGFLVVLNSSINPLIYTVRIRQFRVTFIQLLAGKTLAQAEELENKIFGSNHVEVV